MSIIEALVKEHRRISEVAFWSPKEKAAARAALYGVAASAGFYREFIDELEGRDTPMVVEAPADQLKFGGFIRY